MQTKDEVLAELMAEHIALKKPWGTLTTTWVPHDVRDQVGGFRPALVSRRRRDGMDDSFIGWERSGQGCYWPKRCSIVASATSS